jgi:hypothetical protein
MWLQTSDALNNQTFLPLQELTPSSDSNLMRSVMNLFDTFMDDFYDEKYMQGISDLDERAQLEVSTHFI